MRSSSIGSGEMAKIPLSFTLHHIRGRQLTEMLENWTWWPIHGQLQHNSMYMQLQALVAASSRVYSPLHFRRLVPSSYQHDYFMVHVSEALWLSRHIELALSWLGNGIPGYRFSRDHSVSLAAQDVRMFFHYKLSSYLHVQQIGGNERLYHHQQQVQTRSIACCSS